MTIENVPDPKIQEPTDALIRITTTNICGSDLHMYEGRTTEEGKMLGHENMGIVTDVGPAVRFFRPGDRVSVPFNIGCGACRNCLEGWTSFCTRMNPTEGMDGAAYGYANMGAHPSTLVSHKLSLDEAVNAYESFDKRLDGWTKVLLHPAA